MCTLFMIVLWYMYSFTVGWFVHILLFVVCVYSAYNSQGWVQTPTSVLEGQARALFISA